MKELQKELVREQILAAKEAREASRAAKEVSRKQLEEFH